MKRISTILFFILVLACPAFSQLTAQWHNESFMHHTVNPALLGQYTELQVGILYGRRWDRLRSSPSEVHAAFSMPFKNDRMSLGLSLKHAEIGPLMASGAGLQYAYTFPLGIYRGDKLSLGLSAQVQSSRLDPSNFLAADQGDIVLMDRDNRMAVPPSVNIGFHYASGAASYGQPIAIQVGGAYARFIPYSDRFNIASYARTYQLYGRLAMQAFLGEETALETQILISDDGRNVQTAVRSSLDFVPYGWVALQYNSLSQLMTQAAVRIKINEAFEDRLLLVGSYVWNFGTVGSDLGSGFSIGVGYKRQLSQ
ncbi:MAG: type IX secretion system membrane protein PorP/SprF [Saprospiraceae bacterium]|nr:type IX secretion system membrane protein PorP/SprF [Saprospiraceae bacterium]